jgi:branched-chain amino acid transport system permease protein
MNAWLVLTVNSVTFGGLLFLLSAGFSLIFGLMRIPNLTHGSLFMICRYQMPLKPLKRHISD